MLGSKCSRPCVRETPLAGKLDVFLRRRTSIDADFDSLPCKGARFGTCPDGCTISQHVWPVGQHNWKETGLSSAKAITGISKNFFNSETYCYSLNSCTFE